MITTEKPMQEPYDEDHAHTLERLERELAATRGELRQALVAVEQAQLQTSMLLSSTSWRITAPLRALKVLGGKGALRAKRDDYAASPTNRPNVPAPLRNLTMDIDPKPNATYRLVDARDAMQPLSKSRDADENGAQRRILFLGSTELAGELTYDAALTILDRGSWRELLQPTKFDYLLVEPAWRLVDPAWGYCMVHPGQEQAELIEVLDRCRALSLPTVAWARDDADVYEGIAWLGAHADRIYAIDQTLVDRYRADHPGRPVSLLPLAIQPALHNPVRSYALFESAPEFADKVLYDGWYDLLSQPEQPALLRDAGGDALRICESEWEFGRARLRDADTMQSRILGCVEPIDKNALGKLFSAELFYEGGHRSEARKRQAMLRAAACGSQVLVVGNTNRGAELPEGAVKWLANEQVADYLQSARNHPLNVAGLSHTVRRKLMQEHTYRHRLNHIAEDLGIQTRDETATLSPRVSMILVTKRPERLAGCLERFRNDLYPNKELFVVMHGEYDVVAARKLIGERESIQIYGMRAQHSLGECLNFAIRETESPYWCKVDDDDLYGPSYLEDIMLARQMVDFDLAGKPPVFTFMQQDSKLYWDPRWFLHANILYSEGDSRSAFIAGATILAKRSAVEDVQFSARRRAGADSQFIEECLCSGARVLSADPFGFVRYRAGNDGAHTWRMDEKAFIRSAKSLSGAHAIEKLAFV